MKYALHDELKIYRFLRFPKIRLNRFVLGVVNAFLTVTTWFVTTDKSLEKHKIVVDGKKLLTLYCPRGALKLPCLLYIHGGGFMMREAGFMLKRAQQYAKELQCLVAFPHYRLAPKHPFPAAFDDCYNGLLWLTQNAATYHADTNRIAVAGDSAGGALAAAICLKTRDANGPAIRFQSLAYPVTDSRMVTRSAKEFHDTPGWNANLNAGMWRNYLKNGDNGTPQYAAPFMAADVSGLPPAYIETCEFDCLRDEGAAYALRLRDAGVAVAHNPVAGTFHGFDAAVKAQVAKQAVAARIEAIKKHL